MLDKRCACLRGIFPPHKYKVFADVVNLMNFYTVLCGFCITYYVSYITNLYSWYGAGISFCVMRHSLGGAWILPHKYKVCADVVNLMNFYTVLCGFCITYLCLIHQEFI